MDTTASSFTLRKNAKRAAEAMIRKGTAPAVDYDINPSSNGRFEIVWKTVKAAPTTDEVETEIAEASADQPAAASPTEAASQPAPAATEPATTDAAPQPASEAEAASQPAPVAIEAAPALSEPAPNEWPNGTRVMVRKRKSWREATIISRLDPDHWRAVLCAKRPILTAAIDFQASLRPSPESGYGQRSWSLHYRKTDVSRTAHQGDAQS